MQTIQLKAMTRELCHELYRHWTNDASIYMDMRLFRPYVYDEVAVNRYFDAKGQDASRRLFAIMLGDTVVGELQLTCFFLQCHLSDQFFQVSAHYEILLK